jgi:hypothetical protein
MEELPTAVLKKITAAAKTAAAAIFPQAPAS